MENRPAFHLLGPFQAQNSAGKAIDFGHRKALALLAYLVVEHQRPHAREHLASLLWARTGDERARHNLRQALSKLRTLCPGLLQTPTDLITLDKEICDIDVLRFEAAAGSSDIDELEQALKLYRGDLLEGYVAREADYQDWLELARGRLRAQASDIARRLADLHIEQGRDIQAIDQLQCLLDLDQADEGAHRDLMLLMARAGRRSDALRQYQLCVRALEQEHGAEPAAETRHLFEEIKRGNLPSAGSDANPLSSELTFSKGIQAEMAVLAVTISCEKGEGESADSLQDVRSLLDRHGAETLLYSDEGLVTGFESPESALDTALELVEASRGEGVWRIGLDRGVLYSEQGQWRGDSLSMAQRLSALTTSGGICVSAAVIDALDERDDPRFKFIGEYQARDVAQPVKAYQMQPVVEDATSINPADLQPVLELPGKPSVLLKPFDNISNDDEQDYFAEGLTKDISIALTKIPGLFLALDETPHARASQGRTTKELGQLFGVRYVLCGGVRRHGERVRVNAELIDTVTGQCIWGERYDRELIDLFAIQDEITEEIVTAMDVKLVQGEAARFMRKSLANPSALEASYRGWYALYHGTGHADVLEAQRSFERVIELEPDAPLGYASAALAHWAEAGFGRVVVNSPAMQRAAELARKALELGDTTGYANLVMAVEYLGQRDFDRAFSQVTEGVAARPNCNGAYAIKSSILNFLGRPEEAIEFARYAVRLTPVYPAEFPAVLAACYHDCGRYADAIEAAETSLRLREDDVDPMLMMAASKVALGQLDEARNIAERIRRIDPQFRLSEYAITQPYRDQGNLQRLIEQLHEAGLPE